ncbi:HAD family phosphatase [Flavobacterium sp.]|uniref:HAD family hydrolase n=1 Tax=Flavobacterium sp. TaxID=239 RepID=UPI002623527F|nr:HAD family phosphatase [Flavobacterium sp.]MDD3004045.1 HAD family phosphatase [Flavobacterium sp.]
MIKNIIFDFGDVLIDLNKTDWQKALQSIGINSWTDEINAINDLYEKGLCSEAAFLSEIQKLGTSTSIEEIKRNWCTILGDFPLNRLEFLENISQNYRLFLLSNTDAIHIAHFRKTVGEEFYSRFINAFEKTYFSYEMGLRKPQPEIYTRVLVENDLIPAETLFVDDKKENTDAAQQLGIQTWNLQVEKEDVVEMFDKITF